MEAALVVALAHVIQINIMKLIVLVFLMLFYSCEKGNSPSDENIDIEMESMNESSELELNDLKMKSLQGDTLSYDKLRIAMMEYSSEKFIFWSKQMATSFDYGPAHFDYCLAIIETYSFWGIKISEIENGMKDELIHHFDKAISKNVPGAEEKRQELVSPTKQQIH